MQQKKDEKFQEEMRRFHFCCSCESCVHFNPPRQACSFFWPNEEHTLQGQLDTGRKDISFCKDFELF